MPDHPEHAHLALEQGGLLKVQATVTLEDGTDLLLEDGTPVLEEHETYLTLEQSEGDGLARVRKEGEPYQFVMLEDGSGDVLLELQPSVSAAAR